MSAERNIEMSQKLVDCAEIISRLRGALTTVEAWSDDTRLPLDEAALRDRLNQIRKYAGEAKDIGLET